MRIRSRFVTLVRQILKHSDYKQGGKEQFNALIKLLKPRGKTSK